MKRIVELIVLIALSFTTGFAREFLFESINERLNSLNTKSPFVLEGILTPLNSCSAQQLFLLKFFLVFAFTLWFALLAFLFVRIFFMTSKYNKLVLYYFAGTFLLSLGIYGLTRILGLADTGYAVSRYLLEFIQSPLGIFFLVPGILLKNKSQANNTGAA